MNRYLFPIIILSVLSGAPYQSRTGEFLIDTNVVYVPASGWQDHCSVAFDGTNYLVVWQDTRNSPEMDIYGARVDQDGVVLDPPGIAISIRASMEASPSVAFDGTNYFVVWMDMRNGFDNPDIYGARVNQSGVVLDTDGISISNATGEQRYPSVAFDGTNYLVVWEDNRNESWPCNDIYCARVTPSGILLDPSGIPISTIPNNYEEYPSVAFDGTNCLVVWERGLGGVGTFDIYGARVNPSGIVLDPNGFLVTVDTLGDQRFSSVAFDGANYLVVWHLYQSGLYDIYGTRVTPAGTILDPSGIAICTEGHNQYYPSVTFDGINFLVVWQDERGALGRADIYGARVSSEGVVLDPNGIAVSTASEYQLVPAIGSDGTNSLAVWHDYRSNSNYDIYGARINQSGITLDPNGICFSTEAYSQYSPKVAFDTLNYLVVWQDYRSGVGFDIYGARIAQSGIVLDPNCIGISTPSGNQFSPSVAFDGTNYLVVWHDERVATWDRNIYGARVGQAGIVLDTAGIPISTASGWLNHQEYPSVAFDGTNYLVVWQDFRNDPGNHPDIYATRVSTSGSVLDPTGIAISTAGGDQKFPSVAFDGTNYLVVWQDFRSGWDWDIYGARISPSGIVLDPNGIAICSLANSDKESPSVAFNGTNYLVVWQDSRSGSSYDIYGARVNQSGVVLDPNGIAISTAPDNQGSPSVAFDGTDYLVVWQDSRSGSYDIYGAKVNPSGGVIDSFPVSLQSGKQISPALVCGSGNQLLIAYSGFIDFINGHPANTMRIWGKYYPFPGIAEDAEFKSQEKEYWLKVYPNPFRNHLMIKFQIPGQGVASSQYPVASKNGVASNQKSVVSIKIYDAAGRLVRCLTLDAKRLTPVVWDGTDDSGRRLPAGIYFLRLESDGFKETEKVILLR
uniref:T9SS type A sorting domain-containing protein n=1 Tax=candidate division WOR-3 bacterium TaxID=2052148 RepID=A0A7C4XV28_UNCW3